MLKTNRGGYALKLVKRTNSSWYVGESLRGGDSFKGSFGTTEVKKPALARSTSNFSDFAVQGNQRWGPNPFIGDCTLPCGIGALLWDDIATPESRWAIPLCRYLEEVFVGYCSGGEWQRAIRNGNVSLSFCQYFVVAVVD
ncbi:hypothetical protein NPIL_323661 [Nephila pilipes]|uniref:Uncharacterized protein n=1 Tax=Nephila pilipes TaxID=299642 RepID=A0A8X6R223_NEPPI|nr:hypothetical protein NPIL_323661 [Nephila pilipes]